MGHCHAIDVKEKVISMNECHSIIIGAGLLAAAEHTVAYNTSSSTVRVSSTAEATTSGVGAADSVVLASLATALVGEGLGRMELTGGWLVLSYHPQ